MPKTVAHSFCRTLLLILFRERLTFPGDHGHRSVNEQSGTPGAQKKKRGGVHGAKHKPIERLRVEPKGTKKSVVRPAKPRKYKYIRSEASIAQ